MKILSIVIASSLFVFVIGCRALDDRSRNETQAVNDDIFSPAQTLDIAEATFRHLFSRYSHNSPMAPAYFLSLFFNDPDDEFLGRFSGHEPPIHKGSAFREGNGILFEVDRVKRMSDTKAEVQAGYYLFGEGAEGRLFYLELQDGAWVVTGTGMGWIS